MEKNTIIVGTGSYLPKKIIPNSYFLGHSFYESNGVLSNKPIEEIITTFQKITEINERRYVDENEVASDIGYFAAKIAIESSGINLESIDYIIVATNFGDVAFNNTNPDFVPSIAARIKNKLGIKNPSMVAFDLIFGCPGWLQGMIVADALIQSENAKTVLVVGTETLSRVCDPHDRDSMIFSDGAGATIIQAAANTSKNVGILSTAARTDADYANMLTMGKSYNPFYHNDDLFIKMNGQGVYKYALKAVPLVVQEALEKAGLFLGDVTKLLIHQANGKMDAAILENLTKLYGIKEVPYGIMPMTIQDLGNSSVATIPTLLDLLVKNNLPGHEIKSGDVIVFASVGAGMNINVMVYRMP
ncbi:MAG: ketoacyl-ACP synthase III [candidate division SR1 bacterium]|nr:ketoacyl-ACP synthase III [candidate division SR1 bacterium]